MLEKVRGRMVFGQHIAPRLKMTGGGDDRARNLPMTHRWGNDFYGRARDLFQRNGSAIRGPWQTRLWRTTPWKGCASLPFPGR